MKLKKQVLNSAELLDWICWTNLIYPHFRYLVHALWWSASFIYHRYVVRI